MTYEEAIEILKHEHDYAQLLSYVNQALQMAISSLEKQIAKKPVTINKNEVFDGNWKKICPNCGAILLKRITTDTESYPIKYNMTKHCKCGQAIDWSDT